MKKIVITYPEFFPGEAEAISSILSDGRADRVHLRKPGSAESDMAALIEAIPANLYQRISLHDHFGLAVRYGMGGVHINKRNMEAPPGWSGMLSCSLHTIEELASLRPEFDYAFVSPVYPSISKPDYKPAFSTDDLRPWLSERIYALGGITEDRMDEIREAGFGGAAMLGDVWKAHIDMNHFRLQFISAGKSAGEHLSGIESALQGGCRWIQLRMKDCAPEQIVETGCRVAEICRYYGATFIIDDHVELVHEIGADGVHLGRNDMPLQEARQKLGPMKIIGATANEYSDIEAAGHAGADYIGLGPFRFTTTKKNLSPILGIDGYRRILDECRTSGICLPVVAIGGITRPDVAGLLDTGVSGVAVSGAILQSNDPAGECGKWVGMLCES
ncbi:MAG: thiamine phosphate synthase [Muribaculaceae bacterium]|nr:thiamine phosphate synthase [Muribaculaceae bacterium]